MNSVSGEESRGTIMGIYGTVFSIGIIGGPVLLEFTGTRGARPFVIGALFLVLTLLPFAVLRRVRSATQEFAPLGGLMNAVRAAPVVMLAAAVAGLVESADLALLPLFGLHAGIGERAALLLVTVFMAGNVALQMPIGLLADRFGLRLLLGICALLSGIGPLLLPACIHRPVLLGPLLFLWGGTLYAFYSQGVALMGERVPGRGAAAREYRVRDGVLPGRGDRAESGRHCHGCVAAHRPAGAAQRRGPDDARRPCARGAQSRIPFEVFPYTHTVMRRTSGGCGGGARRPI